MFHPRSVPFHQFLIVSKLRKLIQIFVRNYIPVQFFVSPWLSNLRVRIYIYVYGGRNIRKQSARNFRTVEFSFTENLGDIWMNFSPTRCEYFTYVKRMERRGWFGLYAPPPPPSLGRQGLNRAIRRLDDKRLSITIDHVRLSSCKTDIGRPPSMVPFVIKPRFYRSGVVWEPPDASRICLVPEELHHVHRRCTDPFVSNGFPNWGNLVTDS